MTTLVGGVEKHCRLEQKRPMRKKPCGRLKIDWPKDTIGRNTRYRVLKTWHPFNHNQWHQPKTETSNRFADIGPKLSAMLCEWSLICPKSDLTLVFPSKSGKPLHYAIVHRFFHPASKRAELPIIRFHDMRHTYASLLIDQGENIKYIQTQMGHSKPDVTLNVYVHLLTPSNVIECIEARYDGMIDLPKATTIKKGKQT
jgi:integrase